MRTKIINYSIGAVTVLDILAVLGVMGGFELGNLDYIQFLIGLSVCTAILGLSIFLQWHLSKKRKSPRGAGTPSRARKD